MISISKEGRFFEFCYDEDLVYKLGKMDINNYLCSKCGAGLAIGYCYLMDRFNEAEFLPKDYKHICCHCDYIKKIVDNLECPKCKSKLEFEVSSGFKYIVKCVKCRFKRHIIP